MNSVPVTDIPGVGPQKQQLLSKLGIHTIEDLAKYYPTRYLDFSKISHISNLQPNRFSSLICRIEFERNTFTQKGKGITYFRAIDKSGTVPILWFNAPYQRKLIRPDTQYALAGKTSFFNKKLVFINPQIEEYGPELLHTQGLVPVYPQTEGITSKWLRKIIKYTLSKYEFYYPVAQSNIHRALQYIHFPPSVAKSNLADIHLSSFEHLKINLKNQIEALKLGSSLELHIDANTHNNLKNKLPFTLTQSQERVINLIYSDLEKSRPQHRLIQGETGSGKTVIAVFCAAQCLANRTSFCLMAPTTILAQQHFLTFDRYFPTQIKLITSQSKLAQAPSHPCVFIGTHSLLNQLPALLTSPISSIFIDEQHRFGVNHKEILAQRSPAPHVTNMSATPIPRTLALGLLGDVKITTLKAPHRKQSRVSTHLISKKDESRSSAWLRKMLFAGKKVFVVCPKIHDGKFSVESISHYYQTRFGSLFPILSLHGEQPNKQKQETIKNFISLKNCILISTSLIEVGIDIPDADIMFVYQAEQFGLAQLHQLRGRLARHSIRGYFFLIAGTESQLENERLQTLQKYHNGLKLAKIDLKLRGAGDIAGTRQHGHSCFRLRHFWDRKLFLEAKQRASRLLSSPHGHRIAQGIEDW